MRVPMPGVGRQRVVGGVMALILIGGLITVTGYARARSGLAQSVVQAGAAPSAARPGHGMDPGQMPKSNVPQNDSVASQPRPVATAGFPSGAGEPGIFTDRCGYSHSAPDDPILAFGQPGVSMHHDFFGNVSTAARSTASSLLGGSTTCTTSADSSAYWTPALYQHGQMLKPGPALIYWRKPVGSAADVQTIPAGLQMIAGDETATSPQPLSVIKWTCTGSVARPATTPHDCAGMGRLRLVVTFPSCWDGHTLNGAGQTNVVYPQNDSCPAGHPIRIPEVVFHVSYPTSMAGGLTLSMTPDQQGPVTTAHVDFISGWKQPILDQLVAACVTTSTRCGPVRGEQAAPQGPVSRERRRIR